MARIGHFFKVHWRLIVLTLILIIIGSLLWAWRTVFLPFGIGLILAYLIKPAVDWTERRLPRSVRRHGAARVFSVLFIFLLILIVIGAIAYFVGGSIVDALTNLVQTAPEFISSILNTIQKWIGQLPPEYRQRVQEIFSASTDTIINAFESFIGRIFSAITGSINIILGFAALPLVLYYLLRDSEKLWKGFYSLFPSWTGEHARNIVAIVETVLGRYIRAALILSAAVGLLAFIGLVIIQVPFAPALAFIYGVGELIPTFGPWIAGAIMVLVTLAVAPDSVFWVLAIAFGVQIFENNLLVPKIQGEQLGIHPVVVLFLLVFGATVFGFFGLLIIVPLAATIFEIYKYIHSVAQREERELEETSETET